VTRRVGVIGSMVWDEIHGRDPVAPPIEEWGGIAYALAAMDAALPADWRMVPVIKVGRDLSQRAAAFLRTLTHVAPEGRFIEVPVANNRVTLYYQVNARRCERMSGGVPAWTWPELGPLVADLDALYVNFISGFEMSLGTATALRRGFSGPIYADLHSLFLGMSGDGTRVLQPLPEIPSWFAQFDAVQVNDDEMRELGDEPLSVAAAALHVGVGLLNVTVGARGVIYFCRPDFAGWRDGRRDAADVSGGGGPIRTERIAAPVVDAIDPTGCGDVFGATCCARLLAGDPVPDALAAANRAAARNAGFRGATALARHLRGELVSA
jgi:pfkB family carbohydrate kinase